MAFSLRKGLWIEDYERKTSELEWYREKDIILVTFSDECKKEYSLSELPKIEKEYRKERKNYDRNGFAGYSLADAILLIPSIILAGIGIVSGTSIAMALGAIGVSIEVFFHEKIAKKREEKKYHFFFQNEAKFKKLGKAKLQKMSHQIQKTLKDGKKAQIKIGYQSNRLTSNQDHIHLIHETIENGSKKNNTVISILGPDKEEQIIVPFIGSLKQADVMSLRQLKKELSVYELEYDAKKPKVLKQH